MYQNLIDIFTAPSAVFARLVDKPTILAPLLILIMLVAVTQYAVFNLVDQRFLLEELIESTPDLDPEAERAMRDFQGGGMRTVAMVGGLVFTVLMQVIHATYFLIVSLFSGLQIPFKRWLSFVCWSSMPRVLASLAGIVAIALAPDGRIGVFEMRPLSLLSLSGLDIDNPGLKQLASNVDITLIWSLVLMVIGYSQWTGKPKLSGVAVVLAPFLLIGAIWIYFAV